MTGITEIIGCYIIAVNIAAFMAFGIDKQKARLHRWRIPEATLLGLAVIGGSAGALGGMYIFHHKTRKMKFVIAVPVLLVVQIAAMYSYIYH